METKPTFRRILIEEAIRLMALEVVIGLPPVGIASAMGASPELLNMVAAVSLAVPVILAVLLVVARARGRVSTEQVTTDWRLNKRGGIILGILGLAVLASVLLTLLYLTKGQMSGNQAITTMLMALLWTGVGVWFAVPRRLR